MIFASEVGALTGLNPFSSLVETFETLWLRTDRASWDHHKTLVEQRTGTPVWTLDEAIHAQFSPALRTLLDAHTPERVATFDSALLARAQRAIRAEAKRSVDALWQPKVASRAVSLLNRAYGAAHEPITLTAIERDRGVVVRENNAKFYSKVMGECDLFDLGAAVTSSSLLPPPREPPTPREWAIGGRIDGFVDRSLIEVKNRTSRFMTPLPLYDRAQFETYLRLLELDRGELVECIRMPASKGVPSSASNSASSSASSSPVAIMHKRTLLHRDDAVWHDTLLPLLHRFASFLHSFLARSDLIECYLAGSTEEDRMRLLEPIAPPAFADHRMNTPTWSTRNRRKSVMM